MLLIDLGAFAGMGLLIVIWYLNPDGNAMCAAVCQAHASWGICMSIFGK